LRTNLAFVEPDGRKVVRQLLAGHRIHDDQLALSLFALDVILFAAFVTAAATLPWKLVQFIAGVLAGGVTLRLASIAHDACHNSYTGRRRWNKIIGRLAFLPALQPYSTWEVAHNVIHHSWTSIEDKDYVWIPLSKEEYDRCSPLRRVLERAYRGPFGHGLYYFIELWWRRVIVPSTDWSTIFRPAQRLDILLVVLAACT
jgi:acyl-lipid omega-6 desaturase (Delta-12 desaturase)